MSFSAHLLTVATGLPPQCFMLRWNIPSKLASSAAENLLLARRRRSPRVCRLDSSTSSPTRRPAVTAQPAHSPECFVSVLDGSIRQFLRRTNTAIYCGHQQLCIPITEALIANVCLCEQKICNRCAPSSDVVWLRLNCRPCGSASPASSFHARCGLPAPLREKLSD